jgi:hypothetical protein
MVLTICFDLHKSKVGVEKLQGETALAGDWDYPGARRGLAR